MTTNILEELGERDLWTLTNALRTTVTHYDDILAENDLDQEDRAEIRQCAAEARALLHRFDAVSGKEPSWSMRLPK